MGDDDNFILVDYRDGKDQLVTVLLLRNFQVIAQHHCLTGMKVVGQAEAHFEWSNGIDGAGRALHQGGCCVVQDMESEAGPVAQ